MEYFVRNFIQGLHSNLSGPIEENSYQYSCQYLSRNKNDLGPARSGVPVLDLEPRITSIYLAQQDLSLPSF